MTLLKNTIFKNKFLIAFIILLISFSVIFYQFLKIPKNTTFDEIEFAKLALQLQNKFYSPYSQYATGHATLYFYLILVSFKLFGISLFSLRLPSALFGLLNPFIFYLIIKKVIYPNRNNQFVDHFLPVILAISFVTLRWYFNFARFGFEVTFLLFLELLSVLFVLLFTEKKQRKYLIFSGLFAGLAYNSYQPGRIFVLIPFFLLIMTLLKKIQFMPIGKSGVKIVLLSYFVIPFFLLMLPLTIYLQIHKDTRFYQQFYPDNHEMTLEEKADFFIRNLTSTLGIFNIKGDVNGRHNYPNKPALNPILGILFISGLFISLINIKKQQNVLFLLWFFLSLAPTLVTYPWENPNMLRTFTVIPSVIYFIGLSLTTVDTYVVQKLHYKKLMYLFAALLLLTSSVYELRTYFVHQAEVFKEAFEAERPLNSYLPKQSIK